MPFMPGAPIFGPGHRQQIQDAMSMLAKHMAEIERARAAGIDTGDHASRNARARARLDAIHQTYFPPVGSDGM